MFVCHFSRLFSNHQIACGQVPLNMLSLTHHTNVLCFCDDFSLPLLIKCFAKLSEKSFPFYSQKIPREEDREKTVLRGWPALPPPLAPPSLGSGYDGSANAHGSFPDTQNPLTGNQCTQQKEAAAGFES